MSNCDSIIAFAVANGIRNHPDQAADQMLHLMRENARLESELLALREKLAALARGAQP